MLSEPISRFLAQATTPPTTICSYSGGVSDNLWMANLQKLHDHWINDVGVAHGNTPVDMTQIVTALDRMNNLLFGLILVLFQGFSRTTPLSRDGFG